MRKRTAVFILLIITFIPGICPAGNDVASYMDIGVGARALAMGGAFTAVADDVTAAYWNPAGLGSMESVQGSFMMQRLVEDTWPGLEEISPSYSYLSVAVPFDYLNIAGAGAAAVSVITLKLDEVPHTYVDSNGRIVRDTFTDSETAYCISAGYPLLYDGLSVGGTLKILSQDFSGIDGGNAWGWDIDGGLLLTLTRSINVGFLVNKGPQLLWDSGHVDSDVLTSKLGVSWNHDLSEKTGILWDLDIIQKKERPLRLSAGSEFRYLPDLGGIGKVLHHGALRAGLDRLAIENRYRNLNWLNRTLRWNFGAGAGFSIAGHLLEVDYTFSFHELGNKHRISINMEL